MAFGYKTVLLLGATSGIGAALARKMLDGGSKVILVGRRKERLDELAGGYDASKAVPEVFDITQLSAIPSFVERITRDHPDLDCVVLNSGIQRTMNFARPETIDLSAFGDELTTNYTSYVHLTVALLPFLQAKKERSALVYTSSGLAFAPIVPCPTYCSTKAALHHFLLALRQQLRDNDFARIQVVEIFPPAVQTELHGPKGGHIGMPLDDFTEKAWAGLQQGLDEIPVGMAEKAHAGWEQQRQQMFAHMHGEMEKSGMLGHLYNIRD
ncbi:uncharacterized protein PFL1_00436 [Pseudozyma flocculosa PF-1]|uniref:Related to short-chain dehydrogenase involved in D-alanine esterification of lipoteichoic acid and wall teichoic acid (D-alanine transfer protein) n=1 Tax=Pseudozyma flocculosa TaxID=84751 RepID=A0A5C3ER64_9BASI|nr:uncharacterized protein PFL1_00436 [Pseudozyma flocculosa PF-1]EPQ32239.1 hypothetical protein PFL1_00436 [Pseudozyma flocculosa PF-1]SPO34813.1 related to short-chain dehydrogenase involved in D-alanine esterification of lipoteichoic acid and wall teichoic acid (D-alanine transfer protein) [Pseudozyma flocculosa]